MFSTPITRTFGLTTPIVNAGMAMIARPALAAAVCSAGGLGTIGSDNNPPDVLGAGVISEPHHHFGRARRHSATLLPLQ